MFTGRKASSVRQAVRYGLLAMVAAQAGVTLAQESSSGIEEVVVSAQRRSENINDVPIAITAQSADELRNAGIVDIRDLGNVVPGLTFAGQGAIAVPTIRGVQSRIGQAGNEQPVAMYVDGIYQPNQLVNLMDLVDVTQVEVLKGPQGTLFGRNTTGGAILVTTETPQYEMSAKAGVDYGYYTGSDEDSGDFSARGFITGPIVDDTLAYTLSAYYRKTDGFLTNMATGGGSGEVEKYIVRGKLLWEPTNNLSVLLTASTADRNDLQAFATQSLDGNGTSAFYPDGITSTQPWHVATELKDGSNPLDVSQDALALKIDYDVEGLGTFTSTSSWTENEAKFTVDLDTGTSAQCKATFVCLDFFQNYPNDNFQQELLFTSEQFDRLSFVAGAYYFDDEATFGANVGPVIGPNGKAVEDQSLIGFIQSATIFSEAWAVFGEVSFDVTDRLRAIAGVRYSDETKHGEGSVVPRFPTTGDVEEDAWTPRFALHYDLTDATSIYGSITKGFKSAVLSSFEQTDAFSKSEEILAYEIGVKSSGADYRFSAAAFYYDYTDLQSQVWDGTASILDNADDAEIYGVELEGLYDFTENLQVRATASWLHSEYGEFVSTAFELPNSPTGMAQNNAVDVEGDQLIIAPEFTASLGLVYVRDTGLGELEASGNLYYSDELWWDFLQRVKQDSYVTVNASLALIPAFNEQLRFTLFGRNLSNEEYFTSSLLGPTADAPVYSPPRQIGVGVDFTF